MTLKVWEIWDAEERELKQLREVVEILEKEDNDFSSAKLGEGINKVYERVSELKHEIWEKQQKYREDESVTNLERIVYSLRSGIKRLKFYYKDEKDEKRKRTLEEGIQTLEGAAALIRCQLQRIVIERKLNKRK